MGVAFNGTSLFVTPGCIDLWGFGIYETIWDIRQSVNRESFDCRYLDPFICMPRPGMGWMGTLYLLSWGAYCPHRYSAWGKVSATLRHALDMDAHARNYAIRALHTPLHRTYRSPSLALKRF